MSLYVVKVLPRGAMPPGEISVRLLSEEVFVTNNFSAAKQAVDGSRRPMVVLNDNEVVYSKFWTHGDRILGASVNHVDLVKIKRRPPAAPTMKARFGTDTTHQQDGRHNVKPKRELIVEKV